MYAHLLNAALRPTQELMVSVVITDFQCGRGGTSWYKRSSELRRRAGQPPQKKTGGWRKFPLAAWG